jgi:tetratricopeptide (TPR) repeat protein
MRPGSSISLKPSSVAPLCLAALALVLLAWIEPCPEAVAQAPQAQPGVEQFDGGPADGEEEGPDLIEPDEMAPSEIGPGETTPDQTGRPDAKKGGDEAAPPHSAEESKEDKLDLSTDDLPLSDPIERPKMLAKLYDQLGAAHDTHDAAPITQIIEQLWLLSGSDTVDLLMARAERFVKESDLDLALKILDATVDIAPNDAEAWHRRATVHYMQKDYELAVADLRHALNIDPKHYKAMSDLGVVLEALGAKKEALQAYRKALEVNPFLDDARKAVDSLKREVEGQDI